MGGVSDYSYKYYDPLELYARVTKDYYLTTPNPVPADYLIDVKLVDKPHGSGIDSKKFHGDVGVVGLPSDVGHEYDESAPRELVISIDSLLDSISLQLAYEGGSSVELSSAHGSIRFYTSSEEILYLDYVDGNVGIGTMSPLYKLDVVGVARFSDSVKVGEYWLPKEIGSMSQVLTVDSTGKLVWMSVKRAYALDTTVVCDAETSHNCVPWLLSDDVIFTANWYGGCCQGCTTAYYGIAKGHPRNVLIGDKKTFVNLGVESQTGDDINDAHCVITGGRSNYVLDSYSSIVGGLANTVKSIYGFIGGGRNNIIDENCYNSVITGGEFNNISNSTSSIYYYNTIGGGFDNQILDEGHSTIGGGDHNKIDNSGGAVIAGGHGNKILDISDKASIGGGYQNIISNSNWAVVAGGKFNKIEDLSLSSSILGGDFNNIKDSWNGVICGGYNNRINNSNYSCILS